MNVKNDNISKLQFDEFLRAIGISKNDTFFSIVRCWLLH